MTEIEHRAATATYRGAVIELVESEAPFGDIEDAIDQLADLSIDDKAALWLLAFSLRDPAGHQLDARTAATCVLQPAGAR